MARIRTIKPEFFLNDDLAELPPLDRILFIGLWTQADREGRLEDKSRRIKAAILPYDEHDIDESLTRLEGKKFITRYQVKDDKYIQINNFLKHQYPNVKEQSSTIPAPCKHGTSMSLLRKGKERKGKERNNTGFDGFYAAYPRKVKKPEALKAWQRIAPENGTLEAIMAGLEKWKKSEQWTKDNGKFIPYPATWLNARQWEDDVSAAPVEEPLEEKLKRIQREAYGTS